MLFSYRVLEFVFRRLLPERLRDPLVRALAKGIYAFHPGLRTTLFQNLLPLIGPERASQVAPRLYQHFAVTTLDFFCPLKDGFKNVQEEGAEILKAAHDRGEKVMLVTAHFGNWELGLNYLAHRGLALTGLYARYRDPAMAEWVHSHRSPQVEWVPAVRGAAEACLNALARGRVLGLVADLPYGERGTRVRWGERVARLPLGPWAIASRAQATVIPAFVRTMGRGAYRIVYHEAMTPGTGSFRKQMERLQETYRLRLDDYLTRYPEQWGLLHPFWEAR